MITGKSLSYRYNKPGKYAIQLIAYNEKNELLSLSDTIEVYPAVNVKAYVYSQQIIETAQTVDFKSIVSGNDKVIWYFGDGENSDLNNSTHQYAKEGNYTIYIKVTNEKNCSDSLFVKSITVVSDQFSIDFPTAFAPNDAGEPENRYSLNSLNNDLFYPISKGVISYNLKIFNRRGILLFETNDINDAWTGYYNHRLVSQDVYIWKVVGSYSNGKNFTKVGNVTVIY
jgi:hypothetical protein